MKAVITDVVVLREHLTKLVVLTSKRITKAHHRMDRLEQRIRDLEKRDNVQTQALD